MGHREQTLVIPQIANIPVKDAEEEEDQSKEKERIGTMPERPSVKVRVQLHRVDTRPDARQDSSNPPIRDTDTEELELELEELEIGEDDPTPVVTGFLGPPPPPPLPPLLPLPLFAPLPLDKEDKEDKEDQREKEDLERSDEITWIYRRRSSRTG